MVHIDSWSGEKEVFKVLLVGESHKVAIRELQQATSRQLRLIVIQESIAAVWNAQVIRIVGRTIKIILLNADEMVDPKDFPG